jgi:hypothetical protein
MPVTMYKRLSAHHGKVRRDSTEHSIAKHLQLAAKPARGKQLVLMSNCPPRGVLDRAIRHSMDGLPRPIGSVELRKFLLRRKTVPLVVWDGSSPIRSRAAVQRLDRRLLDVGQQLKNIPTGEK